MSDQFLLRADGSGEPHRRTTDCDGRCLPVVVISPEDREQVERLESDLAERCGWSNICTPGRVNAMQAALREFASPTPPKCRSSISIRGEVYACDSADGHGLPHGSTAAEAIWGESA